jgi:flagellar protein FlaG
MEINSQVKTLTLDANATKVTPAANNKSQQAVQQATVNVQPVENKAQNRSEPVESLASAVSNINDYVQNLQRSLQFTVDEVSGKDIVTVLDKETDEVIRQYPSEEVLEIARRLSEEKDKAISLFNSQA